MTHDTQLTDHFNQQSAFVAATSALGPTLVRALDPDNTSSQGMVAWSPAAATTAYAVAITNHERRFRTLALDFDAGRGVPGQAPAEATHLSRLFAAVGIGHVVTASGGADGRHVLATFKTAGVTLVHTKKLARGLKAMKFETLDPGPLNNAAAAAIRPPLSPHRYAGVASQPLDVSVEVALKTLVDGNDVADLELLVGALINPAQRQRQLQAPGGDTPAPRKDRSFPSGSEEVLSIAAHLRRSGEIFSAFERP